MIQSAPTPTVPVARGATSGERFPLREPEQPDYEEEEPGYRILASLGSGGFGHVYLARWVGPNGFQTDVAIKLLHDHAPAESVKRLRDEARVLGILRHRAIVRAWRMARFQGQWAVVMEAVNGADLDSVLSTGIKIPPAVAVEIAIEVADALAHAWEARDQRGQSLRLLHRDIKPSNIVITHGGLVKVLDFGVARASFANRESQTGAFSFGTRGFCSPERMFGTEHPTMDVYSVGAVLYQMLRGSAFGQTSSVEGAHSVHIADRLSELDAPDALLELLAQMLAFDPRRRPNPMQAATLLRELTGSLGGPSLKDLAGQLVDAAQGDPGTGPLVGELLVDELTSEVSQSIPALPIPRVEEKAPAWVLKTVAALAVMFVVGLAVVLFRLPSQPTAPAPIAVPATAQQLVVGESRRPVRLREEPAVAIVQTKPRPRAVAAAVPVPTTVVAPEDPVEPPYAGPVTHVRLGGDRGKVLIVSDAGKRYLLPADVPPGPYRIEAQFGAGDPATAGRITVGEAALTVKCNAVFHRCEAAP